MPNSKPAGSFQLSSPEIVPSRFVASSWLLIQLRSKFGWTRVGWNFPLCCIDLKIGSDRFFYSRNPVAKMLFDKVCSFTFARRVKVGRAFFKVYWRKFGCQSYIKGWEGWLLGGSWVLNIVQVRNQDWIHNLVSSDFGQKKSITHSLTLRPELQRMEALNRKKIMSNSHVVV